MERINKPISKEYLPIKFFLDDLQSIQRVLKESATGFKIETADYGFTSIDELLSEYRGQKLYNLKITTSNPYISIELNKLWIRLYCGSDQLSETGIFHKLDSIFSASLKRPSFLYSYYTIWIGNIIIIASPRILRDINVFVSLILQGLIVVWILWVGYIRLFRTSEIILIKRSAYQGFLARNIDKIVVNLFTGTIGTILGIIGTIIAYRLKLLK